MNTFQAIDKFLTVVIEGYQMEARVVNNVAAEGCVIPPHNLKQLVDANARAEGAMQARNIISQTVAYSNVEGADTETAEREALPRVIRALETRLDVYLNSPETHLETVKVINDVLRSLRLEVEAVAAK
jgi:hypothetical protein